ncbi:MAG TPA: flagellar motor protein MotB [Candidatus Sulfotelmatobacter sp.]|nr:flagellar motor protein MotB [Candidatus Sulfotelmatobacter sp.]
MANKDREIPVRIIIRKKGHGSGHHGGAWKVAFADFMTAMFALFLVLWLISQSSDVKSAIAGYFQDPLGRADEFGSSILPGEGAQASTPRVLRNIDVLDLRRDRLQKLAGDIEQKIEDAPELESVKDQVQLTLTDEGLNIELIEDPNGVFFETGSGNPSARGRAVISLLGGELAKMPNQVRVDGYTDARPYADSSGYSNWELSSDRANAARRILVQHGLSMNKIAEVRGHADHDLRLPKDPFAAGNRRVTITVLIGPRPSLPSPDSIGVHRTEST